MGEEGFGDEGLRMRSQGSSQSRLSAISGGRAPLGRSRHTALEELETP